MSFASKVLRCNKCDDTTNTYILYVNYQYDFRGFKIRIPKWLGFCHDCSRLTVIENFDNLDSDIETINNVSDQVCKKSVGRFLLDLMPGAWRRKQNALTELSSSAYSLAIAFKRKGHERCLSCLGANVIKFDGDTFLKYGIAGFYEGGKKTGFIHPGCGGEYIVSGSDVRFILKSVPVLVNIDEHWQLSKP